MQTHLDPKRDLVFKSLFGAPARGHLLISLLTAVLEPQSPIREATVLNPEIPRETPGERSVVLDIRIMLDDGRQVDVEMQMEVRKGLSERFLYYWARLYGGQLEPSDPFRDLKPCVSVLFLGEQLLPGERFHSTFRLSEIHDHHELTDRLELHTIELSKLDHAEPNELLTLWGQFFLAKSDEEREALAMRAPEIQQATLVLKELSADERLRQRILDRELNQAAYRIEIGAAHAEGVAEGQTRGREEGEAKGLAEGEAKGLAEGEAKGLRTAIESMAELLGIGLVSEQRRSLESMTIVELNELVDYIRQERRWPGTG